MKIGELAKKTNCRIETIRYYEKMGLLPLPARTLGNYRIYETSHLERLAFIRNCRTLGMSLTEIQAILHYQAQSDQLNCNKIDIILETHIHHVQQRISELEQLNLQLKQLRSLCSSQQSIQNCGILKGLADFKTSDTSVCQFTCPMMDLHNQNRKKNDN